MFPGIPNELIAQLKGTLMTLLNPLPRDYRYTDADVRRNKGTATLFAKEYLEEYVGDFEPLRNIQAAIAKGQSLTVAQIRTVLNCARHDTYAEIPPMYSTKQDDKSKSKPKALRRKNCDIEGFHGAHGGGFGKIDPDDPYHSCPGKYEFERRVFNMKVRVKYPFVTGKSRQTIHKVSTDPDFQSFCEWHPNWRTLGYARDPIFVVRVQCRAPRVLRDPILIPKLVNPMHMAKQEIGPKFCEKCFPEIGMFLRSHT